MSRLPKQRDSQPATTRPTEPAASKTLDRGLHLLKALGGEPDGASVSMLAGRLGMHRPVVYRLLATLEQHRLVRRADDGRYHLAAGVLELAGAFAPRLQSAAIPHLRELADDIGATAHLSLSDNGEAVAVSVVEPRSATMHVAYRVGSRHPLARGAAGLAILAGRPCVADEPARVATARRRGYATSHAELEPNAFGIAVPVSVAGAPAEASIGVVAMTVLDADVVAPKVIFAAQSIAELMAPAP